MKDDSAEILSQSFSAGDRHEQFWHGQRRPLFDVVRPAFSSATAEPFNLQVALKDGFGEAVLARDMPEPCEFPSLDSCQKKFLWTPKKVGLGSHLWSCVPSRRCGQVSSLGLESLLPFLSPPLWLRHGPCLLTLGASVQFSSVP